MNTTPNTWSCDSCDEDDSTLRDSVHYCLECNTNTHWDVTFTNGTDTVSGTAFVFASLDGSAAIEDAIETLRLEEGINVSGWDVIECKQGEDVHGSQEARLPNHPACDWCNH